MSYHEFMPEDDMVRMEQRNDDIIPHDHVMIQQHKSDDLMEEVKMDDLSDMSQHHAHHLQELDESLEMAHSQPHHSGRRKCKYLCMGTCCLPILCGYMIWMKFNEWRKKIIR